MNRIGVARALRGYLTGPEKLINYVRTSMPIACKDLFDYSIDRYYNVFGGMAMFMWFFTNVFDKLGNYSRELLNYKLKLKLKSGFLPVPYHWKI